MEVLPGAGTLEVLLTGGAAVPPPPLAAPPPPMPAASRSSRSASRSSIEKDVPVSARPRAFRSGKKTSHSIESTGALETNWANWAVEQLRAGGRSGDAAMKLRASLVLTYTKYALRSQGASC